MKKVFAFTLVMLLSSFILSVPAFAENIETTAEFVGMIYGRETGETTDFGLAIQPQFSVPIPRQGNTTLFQIDLRQNYEPYWKDLTFSLSEFTVESDDPNGFFGDVGFYVSYYAVLNDFFSFQNSLQGSTWKNRNNGYSVTIRNGNDEIITEKWFYPTFFTPSDQSYPNGATSGGAFYSFTINVPEETPILKISFGQPGYVHLSWESGDPYLGYTGTVSYVIPSASLIANRTSAELKELENITNTIIEQNQLTNEFYGDIISKVDDLYTEVGNLSDLQQEAIDQFDNWNIVTDVPSSVTDKTNQAEDVLDELHQLEKPEPDQIVPDLDTDTTEIAQILEPYFQNTLILQILMMSLGFAFVSYVLFGKKG